MLSALFRDEHSEQTVRWSRLEAVHLISTLGFAEVHAVVARISRERKLTDLLVGAALEVLSTGPWRRLELSPEWDSVGSLAKRWPLRGANLWHLATAQTLQSELGDAALLTWDGRLATAARGEGLSLSR